MHTRSITIAVLALLVLGAATAAGARSVTYSLDIPSQSLNEALQQLALASRHKLFYRSELVEGKKSPALKGEFTAEQALQALLAGTNLTYDITPSAVVLIRDKQSPPIAGANTNALGMRLASAGEATTHLPAGERARIRVARAQGAEEGMQKVAAGEENNSRNSGESSEDAYKGITEIVVTASKRTEGLQETPAAVSVVGGDVIGTLGVVDMTQMSKLVPSLVIGKQGSNAVVFLRGVGQTNSSPAAQPGISTNIDGVYLPRELAGGALFDLERIEVLPGPQGTLYGRNAAGGAINLVTRKPGSDFGTEGFLEAGNYSLFHAFGAVDVPLSDNVAVRGALDVNNRDGYLSNGGNDADMLSGRLSISVNPNEDLSAIVQYTHYREDGLGAQNIAIGTDNPPFGSNDDPYFDSFPTDDVFQHQRGHIVTATVNLRLNDSLDLTYVPGYMRFESETGLQFNGSLYGINIQDMEQYSQELRLSNSTTGPLQWLTGLFWYRAEPSIFVELGLPAFSSVHFSNDLESYAGFGEATYSISDRFRLTAGGRYSRDSFDGDGFQNLVVPGHEALILFGAQDTKDRMDWKIGAQFDVTSDSTLYATAQSGYLQGGYTQADITSDQPRTFEPVTLTAFTVGSKNRFLGNRLQINNEIFYYSYKNYQLQTTPIDETTGETVFLIVNVPKASIYGDQLDITYSASRDTDVNLSVAYLNAKITDGLDAVPSYDDFELPNAPEWTINASVEQRFPLHNGGHLSARVASTYNAGYWTVFTHDLYSRQESFTRTDANLTYHSPDDRWNIGAFVRNIEEAVVYHGSNSSPAPGSFIPTFIDAPRTYGVRVGFDF